MNRKWQKRGLIGAFSLAVIATYGNGKTGEHAPSTIVSLTRFAGNVFEMVVNCPTPATSYPKTKTDLVIGSWNSVGHSTSSGGPFTTNNLGNFPGTNTVYLESSEASAFFGIGEE